MGNSEKSGLGKNSPKDTRAQSKTSDAATAIQATKATAPSGETDKQATTVSTLQLWQHHLEAVRTAEREDRQSKREQARSAFKQANQDGVSQTVPVGESD